MMRRSRLLPRMLWVGSSLASPISVRLAGWFAAALWFVPWQDRRRTPADNATTRPDITHVQVESGGRMLHGFAAGDGPTVLLVHGWADQATSMAGFVGPLVARGYRVVAVDLPAHGASPGRRTDGYVLARAVSDVADRFGAEVVVAHSLGAFATMVALGRGLAIRGVVMLAPPARLEDVVSTFASRLRLRPRAAAGLRTWIERRFGDTVWRELALDQHAGTLGIPALIVHDGDDRQVPVGDARRLAAAWPEARLVETSGLGHRRLLDDAEVVGLVTDFVATLGRPRPATDHGDGHDRYTSSTSAGGG